jgi:hypothetical protein
MHNHPTLPGDRLLWRETPTCGPPLREPLIGQLVLDELDLVVDRARSTLWPRPESPNLPLLKLKGVLLFPRELVIMTRTESGQLLAAAPAEPSVDR